MDELACMQGLYVLIAEVEAGKARPQQQQQSEPAKKPKQQEAPKAAADAKPQQPQKAPTDGAEKKKEPTAKKVVEPPSPELLAKWEKVVAVGEECLEKEELLALMQFKPNSFRL